MSIKWSWFAGQHSAEKNQSLFRCSFLAPSLLESLHPVFRVLARRGQEFIEDEKTFNQPLLAIIHSGVSGLGYTPQHYKSHICKHLCLSTSLLMYVLWEHIVFSCICVSLCLKSLELHLTFSRGAAICTDNHPAKGRQKITLCVCAFSPLECLCIHLCVWQSQGRQITALLFCKWQCNNHHCH